jgi:hypothetical protein
MRYVAHPARSPSAGGIAVAAMVSIARTICDEPAWIELHVSAKTTVIAATRAATPTRIPDCD